MNWFNELNLFAQVYWILAGVSSLVFAVIMVTTFIGGDSGMDDVDMDTDTDMDGAGFQFFTFKNLVGFFLIFSWTGLGCIESELSQGMTITISLICGLIMMVAMATIFYFLNRLVEDGTMQLKNAMGRTGEVYLPIAAKNGGFGKVQINIQGSIHEIQAVTEDEEELTVGTVVKVIKVIDNQILQVTRNLSQP
jgi:hypothetical protein